jgi:hypothetical protein
MNIVSTSFSPLFLEMPRFAVSVVCSVHRVKRSRGGFPVLVVLCSTWSIDCFKSWKSAFTMGNCRSMLNIISLSLAIHHPTQLRQSFVSYLSSYVIAFIFLFLMKKLPLHCITRCSFHRSKCCVSFVKSLGLSGDGYRTCLFESKK